MKSDGQQWALRQLATIAQASGNTLEIVEINENDEADKAVEVIVSIDCRSFPRKDGGVPLGQREALKIVIPAAFPLSRPDVHFTHKRYGDFPHVQWGDKICLYQAPDVEWQPSQGMFGYMQRLNDWLHAGAANELDPAGMPLHPPIAYAQCNFSVIPRVNTPKAEPPCWAGYVEITRESEVVAELGRWIEFEQDTSKTKLVTAILIPTPMPHEYPASVLDLLMTLMARGITLGLIKSIVSIGVLSTARGQPAIFLLGAAMRGIAGGERRQHLACWRIAGEQADRLRDECLKKAEGDKIDDAEFKAWAFEAKVEWCRVLEDRPEIVERRDTGSASKVWQGKHVAILGCGAIGSAAALMVARAGAKRVQLYDNAIVKPGILVRQNFPHKHIGYTKCSSLRLSVRSANPDVEVIDLNIDIVAMLRNEERLVELLAADLIFDATASASVATATEHIFRTRPKQHPPFISMCLGHNADMAMMTLAIDTVPGMSVDIERRSKIALANAMTGRYLLEEFWPTAPTRRKLFQPEPGCSSPTFRGSFTDVLALVAPMMNTAAKWLATPPGERKAGFFGLDLAEDAPSSRRPRQLSFDFEAGQVLQDCRHGFEIRLCRNARESMLSWIRRSERLRGNRTETGGVLFGAVDEFLKVIWIDEVSGPPSDSAASPAGFLCGTSGVGKMNDEKSRRTGGAIAFVGMWHTHPMELPIPSTTDFEAMRSIFRDDRAYLGQRFLMMIVGGNSSLPVIAASVFQRSEYDR